MKRTLAEVFPDSARELVLLKLGNCSTKAISSRLERVADRIHAFAENDDADILVIER